MARDLEQDFTTIISNKFILMLFVLNLQLNWKLLKCFTGKSKQQRRITGGKEVYCVETHFIHKL